MRALSLSRPWPWAIFSAPSEHDEWKSIENRSWPPPISMIGETIALHAAKSWDDDAIGVLLRLGLDPPGRYDMHLHSVIVGVVTIDRVVTTSKTLGSQARWFFEERKDKKQNYGWVLTDKRKLSLPVECKGKQGLWTVPPLIEAAVRGVLGERVA